VRKSCLYAGSDEADKKAVALSSFFAMLQKEEVNPITWLKNVYEQNTSPTPK
jgi:hypothetical protein